MYDRYSLSKLLKSKNGVNIEVKDAFSSTISNWTSFGLDGKAGVVRKMDSLFMEAIKQR